jgi:hypothetical protein
MNLRVLDKRFGRGPRTQSGSRPGGVVILTMLFRGWAARKQSPSLKYNSSHERMCNTTNAAEAPSRKRSLVDLNLCYVGRDNETGMQSVFSQDTSQALVSGQHFSPSDSIAPTLKSSLQPLVT